MKRGNFDRLVNFDSVKNSIHKLSGKNTSSGITITVSIELMVVMECLSSATLSHCPEVERDSADSAIIQIQNNYSGLKLKAKNRLYIASADPSFCFSHKKPDPPDLSASAVT